MVMAAQMIFGSIMEEPAIEFEGAPPLLFQAHELLSFFCTNVFDGGLVSVAIHAESPQQPLLLESVLLLHFEEEGRHAFEAIHKLLIVGTIRVQKGQVETEDGVDGRNANFAWFLLSC